jgi:uncharacterized protein (TIGR02391 family)
VSSIFPKQPVSSPNRADDPYAQVAGKYFHEKNISYYLELGPSGNYVLFEGSQVIGTYEIDGGVITLFVARRPTSKARIEDGSIIDEQGDRWTRPKAPTLAPQPEKQPEPARGTDLTQVLPTSESVLELEPEALAGYLLETLSTGDSQNLRLDHFMAGIRSHYKQDAVNGAVLEAWAFLVREGLLIATKDDTYLISRRGRKLKGRQDLEAYRNSNILPKASLHPVIADRVWPNFIRGEYETAVFQAFKEVEDAVRIAGGFQPTDIGTDLIGKAFDSNSGSLTDLGLPEAERKAMLALFAGAVALLKNPSSPQHRVLKNPNEAAEMISFASFLMRTVDRRRQSAKTK